MKTYKTQGRAKNAATSAQAKDRLEYVLFQIGDAFGYAPIPEGSDAASALPEDATHIETLDAPRSGNVVPMNYKVQYAASDVPNSCGDELASVLKDYTVGRNPETKREECSETALQQVADANGISLDRWAHLNIGMRRMNLGNVLRGMLNKGQLVVVGDRKWDATEVEVVAKPKKAKTKTAKAKKAA